MDTVDIDDMMKATARLTELLTLEVDLLKEMRLTKLHHLNEEKMQLVQKLEGYRATLKANPEALAHYGNKHKDKAKALATNLEKVVSEDEHHLKRAKRVHAIVIKAIKEAMRKNTSDVTSYNKQGEFNKSSRHKQEMSPLSVNQSY